MTITRDISPDMTDFKIAFASKGFILVNFHAKKVFTIKTKMAEKAVDIAAPKIPYEGISRMLSATFAIAETIKDDIAYFVLSIAMSML